MYHFLVVEKCALLRHAGRLSLLMKPLDISGEWGANFAEHLPVPEDVWNELNEGDVICVKVGKVNACPSHAIAHQIMPHAGRDWRDHEPGKWDR